MPKPPPSWTPPSSTCRPSRPSGRPRPQQMDGEAQEIAEEIQDTRRAPVQPPVADDGLRHPGGSAHRGGGRPCISSPPAAGVSPGLSGNPLLFLALGAGVLWSLVLLFTLVKAACDRRDRREVADLQALLDTQQRGGHLPWPRPCGRPRSAGTTPRSTSRPSASRAAAPICPRRRRPAGPPSTRWAGDRPAQGQLTALGGPRGGGRPAGRGGRRRPPASRPTTTPWRSPSRPCKPPTGDSTPGSPPG